MSDLAATLAALAARLPLDGTFEAADFQATLRGLGRDIFFLQIGAMDGISYDPIHAFIKPMGWRGILLEPMPHMMEKLKENYADTEGLTFAQVAIAEANGEAEMRFVDPSAMEEKGFGAGVLGLSSLMPDRGILSGAKVSAELYETIRAYTRTTRVRTQTLASLLAEHRVEKIDLVVMDTEGADWMIARQIDLERYHPRIVYLEYCHLPDEEKIACALHFKKAGYRIFMERDNGENFLAVK